MSDIILFTILGAMVGAIIGIVLCIAAVAYFHAHPEDLNEDETLL